MFMLYDLVLEGGGAKGFVFSGYRAKPDLHAVQGDGSAPPIISALARKTWR
jgi:hypothetical protein